MRLMLHIFKKDARRLWWVNAMSLALLAVLAGSDSRRTDAVPDSVESLLSLLAPAVWAFIAVLLIQGEGPVGDRLFWVTRPYPWAVLLGAKALALVAFIHVPSFAADCAILAARGFNPLGYLLTLLAKQVTLAIAVTVPAVALAAVTRNLAQVVPVGAALLYAAVLLAGEVEALSAVFRPPHAAQKSIPLLGLAVMGAIILCLQYARRRTALARGMAVAALVAAGLVYVFVPSDYVFRTQCWMSGLQMLHQPGSAAVALAKEAGVPERRSASTQGIVLLSIPVLVSGLDLAPGTGIGAVDQLALDITGANGEQWVMNRVLSLSIRQGGMRVTHLGSSSLDLVLDRSVYDRLKGRGASIRGKVGLTFYRWQDPVRMPALSVSTPVPGLGRCSSMIDERYGEGGPLKILCESPNEVPAETLVNLIPKGGGQPWAKQFAESSRMIRYSPRNWLSPLYREQARFNLADRPRAEVPGSQWLVPRDVPSQGEIEVVPAVRTGAMVLSYELHDVDLRQFADGL
jgi:hypothetical protein